MRNLFKAGLLISGMAAILGAATASSAATTSTWRHHHPRRAEVNHRLAVQDHRINKERREGEITKAQAKDLHAEDRGIRAQERLDASRDGGHITKKENRQLNRQENSVSSQIGK